MSNKSTKAEWRRTKLQGLYEFRPAGIAQTATGVFYSRHSVNGRRTFRSLGTNIFEHAKIKHAQRALDVEKDRRRGADLGSDFKTLGALWSETQRRLAALPAAANTVVGRKNHLERLRKHWQRGTFDTFLARNVTPEIVRELREYLRTAAPWRYNFGKEQKGFKLPVVNQTLWVLRVMLDIAVEKSVVIENPFRLLEVLGGKSGTREEGRGRSAHKPQIPSREDMARIIAEMRRVPDRSENFRANPEQRRHLQSVADELADHAELLAYSGMRKEEGRASTVGDDLGDEFKIWGTKSESSERVIPVNPALRVVLDRIKGRRVGAKTKLLVTAEPGKALKRACVRLGLPKIRNHDLRHFFASACISSGVDIPTVSRWLGHSDGGALAMRVYGHLLKDHSQAAAKKVDFSGAGATPQLKTG